MLCINKYKNNKCLFGIIIHDKEGELSKKLENRFLQPKTWAARVERQGPVSDLHDQWEKGRTYKDQNLQCHQTTS